MEYMRTSQGSRVNLHMSLAKAAQMIHGYGHSLSHGNGHSLSHGYGHSLSHDYGHSLSHGCGHSLGHAYGHSLGHGNGHGIFNLTTIRLTETHDLQEKKIQPERSRKVIHTVEAHVGRVQSDILLKSLVLFVYEIKITELGFGPSS
jgi:hypothetical protein